MLLQENSETKVSLTLEHLSLALISKTRMKSKTTYALSTSINCFTPLCMTCRNQEA